jgi:5-oxopent-3-ene-1,2,5-tricarboxylate decarboxylase/2-hydroxyhepta-2,4-diene-1,7-dioate isomerase
MPARRPVLADLPAKETMPDLEFAYPPFRLSGTVVAALLNHEGDWELLGARAHEAPHKAPPRLPVLGVRPPNTLSGPVGRWAVPADAQDIVAGATLGIVIGRPACRIAAPQARAVIAGYVAVADGSLPVESHYRPGLRQRARDGFCVIGGAFAPQHAVVDPDALQVVVQVDGQVVQRADTAHRVRGVDRLVADVSAFMTLGPGDLLLLGPSPGAPRVRAGQQLGVSIAGVGDVAVGVVAEEAR